MLSSSEDKAQSKMRCCGDGDARMVGAKYRGATEFVAKSRDFRTPSQSRRISRARCESMAGPVRLHNDSIPYMHFRRSH